VELATAFNAAKSGGVIVAAIAAVFTIGYVANMLGEDEDWLYELSIQSDCTSLRRAGRRGRNRRIIMTFCRGQSPVHSAHIGQEVEVHYRWHALYGRRLRRQYEANDSHLADA
jgi:hypothetical protein